MADNATDFMLDLDADLDDIAELPGFKVFPKGGYLFELVKGFEEKDINDSKAIVLEMKLKEIVELKPENLDVIPEGETEEKPPIPGDIVTFSWMRSNATGMGLMRQAMEPLAAHLNTRSIREVMTATKGMEVIAILTRTYNKDRDRWYQKLVKLGVA